MGPIAQSTIRTSGVLGIRLLIQAGTLLLVARLLGPEDFGLFSGIAALALLTGTFSTFGTHLVLLGEVSKDRTSCTQILSYAVPTTLIVGSLLFFIYFALCLLIFHDFRPSLTLIVCIGITEILLLPLFGLSTIEELALGKTAFSQLLTVFPFALRTLSAVFVFSLSISEPIIIFSWLYLITALLALGCRKIYKPHAWLKPSQWRLANKKELKSSAGYAALALTAAGPNELDKMLAVKLLTLGSSGIYIVASRVMGAVALPIMALILSALPRLFRMYGNSGMKNEGLNHWIIISVLIYGLFISILLWFFSPWIEQLFGMSYNGMTEILRYFCFLTPLFLLRISLSNILMSMSKPWIRAGTETLGMFFLVIASIIFHSYLGVLGIVLGLALAEIAMVTTALYAIFKYKRRSTY